MTAVWAEIATDASWSPTLLRQVMATLRGDSNGEAVAIEAVTINDPAKPAARWKNLGGGGAGLWQAADGSEIARAADTGFTFSKPIGGTSASFSGAVSVASLTSAGAISGTTGSFSGAVSAASLTASGAISAASAAISGNETVGGTLGVTGAITSASTVQGTRLLSTVAIGTAPLGVTSDTMVTNLNAEFVGGQSLAGLGNLFVNVTGDTMTAPLVINANQGLQLGGASGLGQFRFNATNVADPSLELKDASGDTMLSVNPSGSTYALDVNLGTPATNAARFNGAVLITTDLGVRATTATGGYSGTTGSFSGAISATTGTFFGGISAGASSVITGGLSIVSGGVSATTGTFSGGVSAGASSSFTGGVSVVSGGVSVISGGVTGDWGSFGASAAGSGALRLPHGDGIKFRNGSGTAVNLLSTDASDNISLGQVGAGIGDIYVMTPGTMTFYGGGAVMFQASAVGVGFNGTGATAKPTVTGSRGGNAALASALTALASVGLLINNST